MLPTFGAALAIFTDRSYLLSFSLQILAAVSDLDFQTV